MEVVAVLYVYFFLAINLSLTTCDDPTNTTSNVIQLQPKTIPCSEANSNGKLSFSCTGYTQIPTPLETTFDHAAVDILDLSSKNHMQIVKTAEFMKAGFINVNTIKLDNCNIRTIENEAFRDLELLVEVHLQNNRIESLNMQMFANNERLQILLLSGNQIHQFIGTQFPKLPSLRRIDLRNGSITSIPAKGFEQLETLQDLDLRDNKIQRLNWNTFQNSSKLTHIFLANNQWECDCHMRFLKTFLLEKKIDIAPTVICNGPERFASIPLSSIPQQDLICPPQITGLTPIGSATSGQQHDSGGGGGDVIVYSETGKDIGLDCAVDGYPQPEIIWMKDNRPVDDYNKLRSVEIVEDSKNDTEIKIHYKVFDGAVDADSGTGSGIRIDFKHAFSKHLAIFNTSKDDVGSYECITYHKANYAHRVVQSVFLNLTNIQDDSEAIVLTGGGGKRTWLWILLALLIFLIIALLIVSILIWKKKENQRQSKLREEMLNKFKGSEIIIDDAFSTPRKNESSSSVPLLSNSNNIDSNSIPVSSPRNSTLPDVAQGVHANSSNLSPTLFSPRPPSSELRKHFFSAQPENTIERPSRPGSAMSLSYYGQPPAHSYPRQQHPGHPPQFYYHNRPQQYRMAQFAMRRPWGSSQSLVHPDSSYGGRQRPMLMRQFSAGPAYATMNRFPPHRESVSSMASEPYWQHQSMDRSRPGEVPSGYVTLPRNFIHPQLLPGRVDSGFGPSVSPTESTYSTFSYASTLPPRWRVEPNSDSVGPRTTADGGSNASLNKIGIGDGRIDTLSSINLGLMSPTKGKINKPGGRNNRLGSSSMTPGSLRGRSNDFFSFEPIQEVDGSEADLGTKLTSNTEIDSAFPKLQTYPQNNDTVKYRKKKPPPISAIPPRSRKPIRTFQYSKIGGLKDYDFDESLDGDRLDEESPSLPTSPPPNLPKSPPPPPNERRDRVKSNTENIIEKVEGTEV